MPCSILVFQHVFSGVTYFCATRSGDRGWVLVAHGTVAGTVINSALVSGSTFIQAGTYPISVGIAVNVVNSNVEGSGDGTILDTGANAIDAFTVTANNCSISHLKIVGQLGVAGNHYGVIMYASYCDIGYLSILNEDYIGIAIYSGWFNDVHNIFIDTTGAHGIVNADTTAGVGHGYNKISHCTVINAGDTGVHTFGVGASYDEVSDIIVVDAVNDGVCQNGVSHNTWNNIVVRGGRCGFFVGAEAPSGANCAYNTFSNFTLQDQTTMNMEINAGGGFAVHKNTFNNIICRNVTGAAKFCVVIDDCLSYDMVFNNLVCDANAHDDNGGIGFYGSTPYRFTFIGGGIYNVPNSGTTVSASGLGNKFIGMTIADCLGNGFRLRVDSTSNEVINCKFSNYVFNDEGVGSRIIDNLGYNPRGSIATPWPAAAGYLTDKAAAQNNPSNAILYTVSASPKLIILTNTAGVTQVQIDGVTLVNITIHDPQIYKLFPGQTIKVTWAVTTPNGQVFAE